MKQSFTTLVICLYSIASIAQENFTLTFELVKPNGKMDNEIYFQAKLSNNNDSLSYFVDHQGNAANYPKFNHSFLRGILYMNGKEKLWDYQAFFNYGDKKYILIKPKEEIIVKLNVFFMYMWTPSTGFLPTDIDQLRQCQKIRIKLEKFRFHPLLIGSSDPKHFYQIETIDLYSNWIKINPEDFIPIIPKL